MARHETETDPNQAQSVGLGQKVMDGLNEVRMLMLGGQILLGFQYHAVFTPRFESLPDAARALDLTALVLMLLAFCLLAAVAPFHRIVEHGNATFRLHRFITLMVEWALWPFAICLGSDVLIVMCRHVPVWLALLTGLGCTGLALACWRAFSTLRRRHIWRGRGEGGDMTKDWRTPGAVEPGQLKDKINQLLTEGRLILPGAQALLGFQFTAVLSEAFEKLPEPSRYVHIAGLLAITISVILLMAPPCYHRIVAAGDARPDVERFGASAILGALIPLGLGLAADLYVVAERVLHSVSAALMMAAVAVTVAAALWFGLPTALRGVRPSAEKPSRQARPA
jgi:hypothetical protein